MKGFSTNSKNGHKTIQFSDKDKKIRTIRLGKVTAKVAGMVRVHIDALNHAKITNTTAGIETSTWIAGIGTELHDKLSRVGLLEPIANRQTTIAEFVDALIGSRLDLKPNSLVSMKTARDILVKYFKPDTHLRAINSGMADAFKQTMLNDGYSKATTARTIKHCRYFFKQANRLELVAKNVFLDVALDKNAQLNKSRQFTITRETIQRVIDAAPDYEFRLIIALSRYAMFRCPSETFALRWEDVLWDTNRLNIHAPKTGLRQCPIFPELRPYLETAFEQAADGATHVITRYRTKNLTRDLLRILERLGITPWPRIWHNMRSSAITDLSYHYPAIVISEWASCEYKIIKDHYFNPTDEQFANAAKKETGQVAQHI